MTTSYFAPPHCFQRADYVVLPDDEVAHAVRVLRHCPGDEIVVVDGAGGWYRVVLDQVDKRRAAGTVVETRRQVGEPAYALRIGLALLKNRNRFETFLEKAVELGVSAIIPMTTARAEKTGLKQERAQKILIAAMKQSGRTRLPSLEKPVSLKALLEHQNTGLRLIAHEQVAPEESLAGCLAAHPEASTIDILIGPEGGFTEDEVAEAVGAGYLPVSLGPRRLRAETAALVAATAVMLARG